ncbi:NAD(P)-dependent alcohol dehydrogenase [Raineyella sp.]|uniref:NAD(P)-dependent alcohol dehydrogenase n=1 Tax=Raineyella sp. TaxID=1911550 RepID=UPI002B21A6A4|nr:NAD(P)-dependent alcohol dehydrogenase [Raineyella sp.]MEA5154858.1 NAD(P)-dependent alcohol dehydrogenase [Raineyella sp.]
MSTTVRAWGAPGAGKPLEPFTVERRDLRPDDVRIDISYCGICHSDVSTVTGEWGERQWPLAPGHEIVGVVSAVGSEVTGFRVGDVAGVGCMVDSCGECEYCLAGEEQFCDRRVLTYGQTMPDGEYTQGGYAQQIVVREAFTVHVPETLPREMAAPLLCAGITTYSPLHHWGIGEGSRVAVVGMGGLGHMGVQIAAAMGAEVTVLSHSPSKKADALRFGATDYVATSEEGALAGARRRFDFVLNTVAAPLDFAAYLSTLRVDGVMCNVALPQQPFEAPVRMFTNQRRSFVGSLIGGIAETQEMLDFCAENTIGAQVEVIAADRINEAYDRMMRSDVKYRFAIDASTF